MQEIELKGLNETIYYDVCDNGLKVYMWVKKDINTFYGTLSVRYGGVDTEFKVNNKTYRVPIGIAHFLEHVKFYESKDRTAHDFYFKEGCDTNAFTTFDYTNYQVLGSSNPAKNVGHLLDFVQNGYFSKFLVNREKKIIMEESKMGDDDPYTATYFRLLSNMFYHNQHKDSITGSKEDIKKISVDDLQLIFDCYYHPENMFLIVTGNFNPYEMMEMVRENQSKKQFAPFKHPIRVMKKESVKVKKAYEEKDYNVSSKRIKYGIKISTKLLKKYSEFEIRLYTSLVLNANFGVTSDFREELIEKELISEIYWSNELIDDFLIIYLTINGDYKAEIIKRINEKLANLELQEDTFKRMQKSNIAALILNYEDVEQVNFMMQNEILYYDDIIPNLKEIYENMEYNQVKEFIKLLDFSNRSILVINNNQ